MGNGLVADIKAVASKVEGFIEGLPKDLNKVTTEYLPVITALVKQAEALFPAASSGAAKLNYVTGLMGNVQNELTSAQVTTFVNTLVSSFNQGGVFASAAKASAANA